MNEVKTSLKRLGLFYFLLALGIFGNCDIIPCRFPLENISSLYFFSLTVCLILHFYRRVAQHPKLRKLMLTLACMEALLVMLRGIKYSVFGSIHFLARYSWYLFFIPMLFIPVLLFYISLYIDAKDERLVRKRWGWVAVVTVLLILLVFTNDFHQMVYGYNPGFDNWDLDYSHGWAFAVVTAWEYGFYVISVVILIVKCSISKVKNQAWLIMIPFVLGVTMIMLKFTDTMPKINGHCLAEFPEMLCCMVTGVLECCMQLGMIPTNESYRELMKETSVRVQITDRDGNVIYKANAAKELTKEQFSAPDKARIGEHTILRRMDIPGGYGFWENDVTELDKLNEELAETGEALSEEARLVQLQNELKEKQAKIDQRTAVYDTIARRTQNQSMAISRISDEGLKSDDPGVKDRCRKHIALLGAYIKRYANLTLLSESTGAVSINELALSVTEVLRYLNRYGMPGELLSAAEGSVPAEEALTVFEAFETLLENHLPDLTGAFVNLDTEDDGFVFRLTLENMGAEIPASVTENLLKRGIQTAAEYEDNVGYISFVFPKGGAAA